LPVQGRKINKNEEGQPQFSGNDEGENSGQVGNDFGH